MRTVRFAIVVSALCIVVAGGCSSSSGGKASSSTSTVLISATSYATIPASTTTSTPSPTVPSTGPAVLSPDDAHLVADCVQFIPIGAVTKDDEATNLFAIVGGDLDKLNELCTQLLTTSPGTLNSLSLKLRAFELAQETATQESGQATSTVIESSGG